ncbi:uroporphyrinogen-III C-methyltransferase [Niveibacterium terrae]|uniref:uroporphyrinogen-III C-methyltransferase n=1 Tax=Niveibacterium terrae TaxID=3373598 RepID=UPI003A8CC4F2
MRQPPGIVHLVGAGPGETDLLTLRAARLIASADAIVFDHLVGGGVLELARADAQCLYVGKQAGHHTLDQAEINARLVRLARDGLDVVRLKGGDPFIFGRGGEEILALVEAGIRFDVTPGVTAASGAAAYSGIPLTHRQIARSCVFATGHFHDGSCDLDWPSLARPDQTVVIYMGVGALPVISAQLIAHGLAASTPAAAIRNASLPDQKTLLGTLADLPEKVRTAKLTPPALLVIGEVVRLRDGLNWFEQT